MAVPTPDMQADPHAEVRRLLAALQTHNDLFGPYHLRTLAVVHSLAIALWQSGNIAGAIDLLAQARDRLKPALGEAHPARVEMLHTLGQIASEEGRLAEAADIFREVLDCDVRHAGPNHPKSLEAKGDLAAVLFELGQNEEAEILELEAYRAAHQHLGLSHSITTILSWNRALSFERRGDLDSAKYLFINELSWLLREDPRSLQASQNIIRNMLAERLRWNAAPAC